MRYFDPRIEEMPPDDIKRLQYRLLKTLVYRLYSFSPFYHDRMRETGVHPDDIQSLEDIRKLPFMYKSDLRDNYPDKIFVATQDDLVRYHVSTGITGPSLSPGDLSPAGSGEEMSSR
jgi:phenylacetate-CoA ligase